MINLLFQLQASGNPIMQFLPLMLIMVVFYFFFIRPQARKQKDQGNFVKELEKGDEVVTSSGLIGRISKIEGNVVQLQLDQKTFVKILRSAISNEMTAAYLNPGKEEPKRKLD